MLLKFVEATFRLPNGGNSSHIQFHHQKQPQLVHQDKKPSESSHHHYSPPVAALPEVIEVKQHLVNKDGDFDFILGNWGLNSKFKASADHPLRVYTSDFDGNGQTEPIVAVYKENAYYPLSSTDDLSTQLVSLRKSFSSYNEFAGKSIVEIFSEDQLKRASLYEAEFLGSGFLRNEKTVSDHPFIQFENELQTSPINSSLKIINRSGDQSLLLGGNYLGVKPYHGKYDTFSGALINKENDVILGSELGLDFKGKAVRALIQLHIKNKDYLLAIFNNEAIQLYKINTK